MIQARKFVMRAYSLDLRELVMMDVDAGLKIREKRTSIA